MPGCANTHTHDSCTPLLPKGYRHAVVLALFGGRRALGRLDGEPVGLLDGELASAYFKARPCADPRTGYTNGATARAAAGASSSSSSSESSNGRNGGSFDWSAVPLLPDADAAQRCPPELVAYQARSALAA